MYSVIDETASFIVIYKKPGVNFHCEDGAQGLFEAVKVTEGLTELYPVHRLDKMTSGLLVMAKTAAANKALNAEFAARHVHKLYLAISTKKPRKKQGLVKGDMEKARRGAWKLTTAKTNPAMTQFRSVGLGDGRRLFVVKPHTGKTHQIRVALKSIGAPILGDELYGDSEKNRAADRGYLHAYALAFDVDNKRYVFKAMPQEGRWFTDAQFLTAMAEFQDPLALSWPDI